MSKLFYEKLATGKSSLCLCSEHLHTRPWIPPPCKSSPSIHQKRLVSCKANYIDKLSMADTKAKLLENEKFKKIKNEIATLKAAEIQLEAGELLSEETQKLIDKWQKKQDSSLGLLDKSTQMPKKTRKHKEVLNANTKKNLAILHRLVQESQEVLDEEKSVNQDNDKQTNMKSLIKENRRLMKRVKKLETQQDKDEEEQLLRLGDYRDKSIKSKYSDLLLYVVKLEAENKQLKQEHRPSHQSESADEKAVGPFKQRIRLLEDQLQKQSEELAYLKLGLSSDKDPEFNKNRKEYEAQLLEKLGHTREVYERAIQGYKEELQKLLEKCTKLQEENHHLKSDGHSDDLKLTIDKLELLCSEKDSVIHKLEIQIKEMQDKPMQKLQQSLSESLIPLDTEAIFKRIEEALGKKSEESSSQINEEKLATKNEEISVLNRLCEEYKCRIEDLSSRLEQAESVASSTDELLDLKKELEMGQRQIENLSEHILTLKDQNKNFAEQIKHLQDQLVSSSKHLESKDAILDRVSLQLENKIQECSSLTIQVSKLAERTEITPKLNGDLENGYKLQIKDLQTQNSRLLNEISRANSEKDKLEQKLRSEARSLEEQVDKLTLKNNACQRQLDTIISAYRATFSSTDGLSPRTLLNSHINSNYADKP